jgi:hypothetical protein
MRGSLVLCREYRRRMSAWWCRDTARTDQSQCDRTVGEGLFHGRKRPRGLTDRRMGRVVFTKDFPDIALVARRSSLHHKAKIRPHSSGLRRRVGCQCHGLEASDDGGRAREAQRCSNLMRRRFRSATYERIMALRQAGESGREQDAVPERGVPTGPRGGMRIGLHGGTGSVVGQLRGRRRGADRRGVFLRRRRHPGAFCRDRCHYLACRRRRAARAPQVMLGGLRS